MGGISPHASMTITEIVIVFLVVAAVVVVPLVLNQVLADRRHRRAISHFQAETVVCPHCHATYGAATTVCIASSLWNPTTGFHVSQLDLPDFSYFATCSRCARETEHREDGRVFELPAEIQSRTIVFPV